MFSNWQEPVRRPNITSMIFLVAMVGGVVCFFEAAWIVTDWLWFQEVGYTGVFWTTFWTKLLVGGIAGLVFFLFLGGNLYFAENIAHRSKAFDLSHIPFPELRTLNHRNILIILVTISVIFGILWGVSASSHWEDYLLFLHGLPFGINDPLFQKDIGFYVFRLPFIIVIYNWVSMAIFLTILSVALLYFLRGAFTFVPPRTWRIALPARNHVTILFAVVFFIGVLGAWIELQQLLFVKRGVVFGPGYTDVTTQVWVLRLMIIMNLLAGLSFIPYLLKGNWKTPVSAVVALFAVSIIGKGIYPNMVQKFKVLPNEIVLEEPYIAHNIHYTRLAYHLNNIEQKDFPVDTNLTGNDLTKNDLTIKNIRLWDHEPLLRTFSQLQEIRTYYKFLNVDNDRYMVDGEYRQVMLSPRELSYNALPSRTWVNEHLIYTHGYGVVKGPVNRVSQEGLPEFFIKDIPPVFTTNIQVTRPEIYYGEESNDYVFVRTKQQEFDYPVGERNVFCHYEGEGGVPLNFFRKVMYSIRFRSLTILLSNDITSESRIMYQRRIKERIAKIVPFMRIDSDPYLMISDDGRLLWIIDGYTVTNRFPYSEPFPRVGNYVRNSMKATIDAFHGTVNLYISDQDDPIIQTYARIFPNLFKPMEAMTDNLKSHIRYPQDMMQIQAMMYRAYHMEDPQIFYNKEDLWSIPGRMAGGGDRQMEPYYTIMKLPEEQKEEFILLLPFTPRGRPNMSAWLAARCDAPHYGKLIVYKFPKQSLVFGPQQIEARIDQDDKISMQLSLWNRAGSQVIRGSLLAIPINTSILYVQPLYLAADRGQLPELKRVIVAFGNSIAMEDTMELSLNQIFGADRPRTPTAGAATPGVWDVPIGQLEQSDRETALQALRHYRRAQEFLRQNRWSGYGEELQKMEELLRSLER